jgi:hypothetical protein
MIPWLGNPKIDPVAKCALWFARTRDETRVAFPYFDFFGMKTMRHRCKFYHIKPLAARMPLASTLRLHKTSNQDSLTQVLMTPTATQKREW